MKIFAAKKQLEDYGKDQIPLQMLIPVRPVEADAKTKKS